MKRDGESKKQRVFFSRNPYKHNFFRSFSDGKSNALLHHCTFKDWSLRDRVVNLCPFSVGGPLYLWDIKGIGQAALPCVVCLWHGWKYCVQTGRLKETHKRNITLGTYPVRVNYKGELFVGFESLSPDYFNILFNWFLKECRSSVEVGNPVEYSNRCHQTISIVDMIFKRRMKEVARSWDPVECSVVIRGVHACQSWIQIIVTRLFQSFTWFLKEE